MVDGTRFGGPATATASGPALVVVRDVPINWDRTGQTLTADGSSRSRLREVRQVLASGRKGMVGTVMKAVRPGEGRVLMAIEKAGRESRTLRKHRWPTAMVPWFDQAPRTVLETGRRVSRRTKARWEVEADKSRSHNEVAVPHPVAYSEDGNDESRGFQLR